jgi:hypothetical protein
MNYEERRKIAALVEKEIEMSKKLNESSSEYLNLIKQIKSLHNEISNIRSLYLKQEDKVEKAKKKIISMTDEELKVEEEKLKILARNLEHLEKTTEEYTKMAKEAGKTTKVLAAFTQTKNDVVAIGSTIKNTYNRFKSWSGLFDIDKSIRTASLSMGLLGKRSDVFRENLKSASNQTIDFGVGMKELAELQSNFSQELGRSVLLNKENLIAIGEIAAATGLGAEGAAKMAADMELQGYSAERTRDFIEQTMNDSSKMGLNASKVIKNIQQNMKLLNKYNFKGGVKGLKQMAETVTRLGVDMSFATGMADKLFDIEGAIDMSAQLQVMGGEWANLADPFRLMYMARNDMAGLTEELAKAAASTATFNAENGEFEISALEMHKLRKVAEQTGEDYEKLATAAKNAAKFSRIKSQMRVDYGDKDVQKFIEDVSTINKKGEAVIELKSGPKLVRDLSRLDANAVKAMMDEQKKIKERAEAAQTFDDKLTNLTNKFKELLMPVIKAMSEGLEEPIKTLSGILSDKDMIKAISQTAMKVGELIGAIGSFVVNNPITAIASLGLFEAAKWYMSGIALGKGFNSVASVGGGGSGVLDSLTGGKSTKGRRRLLKSGVGKGIQGLGRVGGKLGGKVAGGVGKALGKSLLKKIPLVGLIAGLGFGVSRLMSGDWAGALGEVASGAASTIPGLGTAASVVIDAGLAKRDISNEESDVDDGIIKFNPKDKFMKVNDSTMIAGTSENGNAKLAKMLSYGLPGIGTGLLLKDLMSDAMNKTSNQVNTSKPSVVKVEFGDVKFKGEINLIGPGNASIPVDFTKDTILMSKLSEIIHTETEKVIQGGKVKG